jgi:DNA-binding NarL/FixJ family response regulator
MKKFTIIAVDDDESYLDSLKQFFSKHTDKYDLSSANCVFKLQDEYNIEYMLEKIENVQPDVVLMDFSFTLAGRPHDFGIELVHRIKMKFPDQKIIMLVGDDDEQDQVRWDKINRSFNAGATAYLGKKDITNCMEAIDEVVKGDVYLSESAQKAFFKAMKENGGAKEILTLRQREVLKLLSEDYSIAETAARLLAEGKKSVTPHVVNFHIQNIKQRLNTRTLHGSISKALRENII